MTPKTNRSRNSGVPYFTSDEIATRCAEVLTIFEDLKANYPNETVGGKLGIDEDRLYLAIMAFFHDVARYKWWHYRGGSPAKERLNQSKNAGLICYWLNKLGPAFVDRTVPASQVIDPATDLPEDPSLMLNASFALTVASIWLGHELNNAVTERLLYELQWRDVSAKSCLTIFELLDMSRGKLPLVSRKAL